MKWRQQQIVACVYKKKEIVRLGSIRPKPKARVESKCFDRAKTWLKFDKKSSNHFYLNWVRVLSIGLVRWHLYPLLLPFLNVLNPIRKLQKRILELHKKIKTVHMFACRLQLSYKNIIPFSFPFCPLFFVIVHKFSSNLHIKSLNFDFVQIGHQIFTFILIKPFIIAT